MSSSKIDVEILKKKGKDGKIDEQEYIEFID